MVIYSQGEYLLFEKATVPIGDHGYLYGVGLFETFRSWRGGCFQYLHSHLERLLQGCRFYGIEADALGLASKTSLRAVLAELLERNNIEDAVFRLTVSAGETPDRGLPIGPYRSPRESILVRPLPPEPLGPIRLHVLKTVRTQPETPVRAKSSHYFNSLSGYRELRSGEARPGDEGIMFSADGRVVEGTTTNVFVVRNGLLLTPPVETGLLPGIARSAVLDLARKAGIPVAETDVRLPPGKPSQGSALKLKINSGSDFLSLAAVLGLF